MPVLDEQMPEGWLRNHIQRLIASTEDIALGMMRVQAEVERLIGEHWEQEREDIACCAGCSHCCIVNVSVLHAEAVVIESYLRDHLRQDELDDIVTYAKQLDISADGLTDDERIMLRKTCPLLGDSGRCRIYPVRPLLCRALTSLSAEDCRLAPVRITYGEDPRIMMHLGQKSLTETGYLVVAEHLESKGFPPPRRLASLLSEMD